MNRSDLTWFKAQEAERNAWRKNPMDKHPVKSEGKTVAWIKKNPNQAANDIEHLTELLAAREADIRQSETRHREMVHKLKQLMG